jgi:hypothetical protein
MCNDMYWREGQPERIDVVCGWGECIDVLITNRGQPYMLYEEPSGHEHAKYGISRNGSIELNRHEARSLAYHLLLAAQQCDDLDRSAEEYFEKEEKEHPEMYAND